MKSPTHLEKCIVCPKCGTKTMRKALGKNPVAEYFDDRCHQYFTIEELVNEWNYDLGDFGDVDKKTSDYVWLLNFYKFENQIVKDMKETDVVLPIPHLIPHLLEHLPNDKIEDKILSTTWFNGEPLWKSKIDRENDYNTVTEMFLEIPSWEDNIIDTGLYR